jgi:hypothetical protein
MQIYIYINIYTKRYITISSIAIKDMEHESILKIKSCNKFNKLIFQVINDENMNYDYECMYIIIDIVNKYPKLFFPIINSLFLLCNGTPYNIFPFILMVYNHLI